MPIITATRIHTSSASSIPDFTQLEEWCTKALEYSDAVLIATNQELFNGICKTVAAFGSRVHPLLVSPWKSFTLPLNAIIVEATSIGGDKLLLQSFEIRVLPQDVQTLSSHLTSDTLVVGAKLVDTHGGSCGVKPLDGMTAPWNTFALWNLHKLCITGFLGISSGLLQGIPGGIEEVVTISVQQQLYPNQAHAKLITLPQLQWANKWEDAQRLINHQDKMSTKILRAELQLQHSRIERGVVTVL